MQEKFIILTFILCVISCLTCQNSSKKDITLNDFPQKEFEKVVAYKMSGEYGYIIENDKLSKNLIKGEKALSKEEINTLIGILQNDENYGDVVAKCFEPRLGYVFYDENDEAIAHITICLACNQIITSPKIGAFILGGKGKERLYELEETIF